MVENDKKMTDDEKAQAERDAYYDEWWERTRSAEDTAERDDLYFKWQKETTGTMMQVWTIDTLLEGKYSDTPEQGEDNDNRLLQLQILGESQNLVHPDTKEPLIEVISGGPGCKFNGHAVFLTESGRAAEGWWENGKWRLEIPKVVTGGR